MRANNPFLVDIENDHQQVSSEALLQNSPLTTSHIAIPTINIGQLEESSTSTIPPESTSVIPSYNETLSPRLPQRPSLTPDPLSPRLPPRQNLSSSSPSLPPRSNSPNELINDSMSSTSSTLFSDHLSEQQSLPTSEQNDMDDIPPPAYTEVDPNSNNSPSMAYRRPSVPPPSSISHNINTHNPTYQRPSVPPPPSSSSSNTISPKYNTIPPQNTQPPQYYRPSIPPPPSLGMYQPRPNVPPPPLPQRGSSRIYPGSVNLSYGGYNSGNGNR